MSSKQPMTKIHLLVCAVLVLLIAQPEALRSSITPTPFHYTYGSHCMESGRHGMLSIQQCANEGYIYVGTTDYLAPQGCGASDVYVVRLNNNGSSMWERTYDIADAGGGDVAHSMIECQDGSGFLIVGATDLAGSYRDIFILKIDCNGNELWTNTYGGVFDDVGFGIVETRNSMDILNPNSHDIVVVGYTASQTNQTADPYIFRTKSNGALLWDAAYRDNGVINTDFETMIAVTEATPAPIPNSNPPQLQQFGDIVAVGHRVLPGVQAEAYVLRVDGTNGQINRLAQPLQGAATFGMCVYDCNNELICGDEAFTSVIELQNPAEVGGQWTTPNVVIAGYTRSMNTSEVVMVKLIGGDPCTSQRSVFGDGPITCTTTAEEANQVREVTFVMPGSVNQWDLAVTGVTNRPAYPNVFDSDAFICTVDPTTLLPTVPGRGFTKAYGKVNNYEEGFSIDVVTAAATRCPGFVIGGNYQLTSPSGTHTDLYVVDTRPNGNSADPNPNPFCERDFLFQASAVLPTSVCSFATVWRIQSWNIHDTQLFTERDWGLERCDGVNKQSSETSTAESMQSHSLRLFPSPLAGGDILTIAFPAQEGSHATIRIVNTLGVEVFSKDIQMTGSGQLDVNTSGWARGSYAVEFHNGGTTQRASFILSD